jgi:hypothetical protein
MKYYIKTKIPEKNACFAKSWGHISNVGFTYSITVFEVMNLNYHEICVWNEDSG